MSQPSSSAGSGVNNSARSLCVRALREWERGRAFSDEILHRTHALVALDSADRAFLTELFFGVLRHLRLLDFWIGLLRSGRLDPDVRALLRIGLYQIFLMRVPAHAAVFETVALSRGPARGLVNGVLRRAVREQETLQKALEREPDSVGLSHPDFLWERWLKRWGRDATVELCRRNNTPAEVFFRINSLRVSREELVQSALGEEYGAEVYERHAWVLRVQRVPRQWIESGWGYVQDPSTLYAPDLLDPQPGERVWDACAAPGGKATYLAQKMKGSGLVVASDLYESRVARLRENCARMGVESVEVCQGDALLPPEPGVAWGDAAFDRILLDVPCSNTGVLRRRVDVRWRLTEEDFVRMPVIQFAFLQRAFAQLRPGGRLVYSTCSIEWDENEGVVERAQREIPGLRLLEMRTLLPELGGGDGAFAALFERD
jgi:16S rRNA (cytosine967-C5)-methyltransferase